MKICDAKARPIDGPYKVRIKPFANRTWIGCSNEYHGLGGDTTGEVDMDVTLERDVEVILGLSATSISGSYSRQ